MRQRWVRMANLVESSLLLVRKLAQVLGAILLVLITRARRPQNGCGICGYRWFPRGKSLSLKCPRCGGGSVQIWPEAEGVGWVVLGFLGLMVLSNLAAPNSRSQLDSSSKPATAQSINGEVKSRKAAARNPDEAAICSTALRLIGRQARLVGDHYSEERGRIVSAFVGRDQDRLHCYVEGLRIHWADATSPTLDRRWNDSLLDGGFVFVVNGRSLRIRWRQRMGGIEQRDTLLSPSSDDVKADHVETSLESPVARKAALTWKRRRLPELARLHDDVVLLIAAARAGTASRSECQALERKLDAFLRRGRLVSGDSDLDAAVASQLEAAAKFAQRCNEGAPLVLLGLQGRVDKSWEDLVGRLKLLSNET